LQRNKNRAFFWNLNFYLRVLKWLSTRGGRERKLENLKFFASLVKEEKNLEMVAKRGWQNAS
jgi:hypothetical protein